MTNLGIVLHLQRNYEEAEQYLRQAFEVGNRVLGGEHPQTLIRINILIELYKAWGKREEARKYRDLYRDLLNAQQKQSGPPSDD